MMNWHTDKQEIVQKTVNAVYDELENLLNGDESANHWMDSTHNVFAFVHDNGDNDRWIEMHLELYDANEDIIGDILVLDTEDVSENELRKAVEDVVREYFHE
jgi:hypothetical protein